jgi:hypothetical protein
MKKKGDDMRYIIIMTIFSILAVILMATPSVAGDWEGGYAGHERVNYVAQTKNKNDVHMAVVALEIMDPHSVAVLPEDGIRHKVGEKLKVEATVDNTTFNALVTVANFEGKPAYTFLAADAFVEKLRSGYEVELIFYEDNPAFPNTPTYTFSLDGSYEALAPIVDDTM